MFDHSVWFVPYVAGYYAARYARFNGITVPMDYERSLKFFTRDWVMQNAKALIEYGQGLRQDHIHILWDAETDPLATSMAISGS